MADTIEIELYRNQVRKNDDLVSENKKLKAAMYHVLKAAGGIVKIPDEDLVNDSCLHSKVCLYREQQTKMTVFYITE